MYSIETKPKKPVCSQIHKIRVVWDVVAKLKAGTQVRQRVRLEERISETDAEHLRLTDRVVEVVVLDLTVEVRALVSSTQTVRGDHGLDGLGGEPRCRLGVPKVPDRRAAQLPRPERLEKVRG